MFRPRQFGDVEEDHEDDDEDGHDFVDAESETNDTSSLSEASPSPQVEERPIVKLRAVAEHDFLSDNPKVMTTFISHGIHLAFYPPGAEPQGQGHAGATHQGQP